jgi:hypothetical protein
VKWDYLTQIVPFGQQDQFLGGAGNDGWDLAYVQPLSVQASPLAGAPQQPALFMVFKRPRQDEATKLRDAFARSFNGD